MKTADIISRLQHAWPLLLVILLVLLAALPTLTYPMGRDQGMYANIGLSILNGGTPYVDVWDIKPPPIYYIYAAGIALFGRTAAAVRAIDFALVPLGMAGVYLIGQRLHGRRLAVLAALFYGVFYFTEDFPSLTQNDSLVTIPMIWASYAALRVLSSTVNSRAALGWAFSVGLLCGVVLWFKHYLAFFVLALVVNQLIARRAIIWREALAFALGGLLTGGGLLLYFWSQGMVQEMWLVAQGTAAYNAQGRDFITFLSSMGRFFYFKWLVWGPLWVLAALWLPLYLGGQGKPGWRLIILWWLAGLAFLLIQALGFDTHWIPMLPPLALFAADALDRVIQKLSQPGAKLFYTPNSQSDTLMPFSAYVLYAGSGLAVLLVLAGTTWGRAWPYLSGQESQVAYFDRFQANDLKPEESLQMADYLRQRVRRGDTLFIWGFRPEVYFMADLRPATRYQAQFPLTAPWYPQAWQQHNVDLLWAAMPPFALVLEDDFMPWVTNIDADSHTILQGYTELNNWLIANYERIDEIGDFIIWQRKQV